MTTVQSRAGISPSREGSDLRPQSSRTETTGSTNTSFGSSFRNVFQRALSPNRDAGYGRPGMANERRTSFGSECDFFLLAMSFYIDAVPVEENIE